MSEDNPDQWTLFRASILMQATAYNTGVIPIRLEFGEIPQGSPEYEALMTLWRIYRNRAMLAGNTSLDIV